MEAPPGLRGAAFGLKFDFFLMVNDIAAVGSTYYMEMVVS